MQSSNDMHWYAIYTHSNAEKKLYKQLVERNIQAYLPVTTKQRQWSDRVKIIEQPLFKSYLFINVTTHGLHIAKTLVGFSHFIRFGRYPVHIPSSQILLMQQVLTAYQQTNSLASALVQGSEIRIVSGALAGLQGCLVTVKGKQRVAIEIEKLQQSLLVDLPINHITPVRLERSIVDEQTITTSLLYCAPAH